MSEILARQKVLLLAAEATYGTDGVAAILTDEDADIVYQNAVEPTLEPAYQVIERSYARASVAGARHQIIKDLANLSFTIPFGPRRGTGAGNETPWYDMVLGALNLREAIVSGTSATYNLSTRAQQALTAYLFERNAEDDNWRLKRAVGCRGTATLKGEVGQDVMLECAMVGKFVSKVSAAAEYFDPDTGEIQYLADGSTAVTARSGGSELIVPNDPYQLVSASLALGAQAIPIDKFELSTNWTADPRKLATADPITSKVILTRADSGRVTGTFGFVDGAAAHDAVRDAIEAGTEAQLTLTLVDASGTHRCRILAPKCQLLPWAMAARGGMAGHDVPFALNGDLSALSWDNDMTIVFDAVP